MYTRLKRRKIRVSGANKNCIITFWCISRKWLARSYWIPNSQILDLYLYTPYSQQVGQGCHWPGSCPSPGWPICSPILGNATVTGRAPQYNLLQAVTPSRSSNIIQKNGLLWILSYSIIQGDQKVLLTKILKFY